MLTHELKLFAEDLSKVRVPPINLTSFGLRHDDRINELGFATVATILSFLALNNSEERAPPNDWLTTGKRRRLRSQSKCSSAAMRPP
jgi:hypothetical protein